MSAPTALQGPAESAIGGTRRNLLKRLLRNSAFLLGGCTVLIIATASLLAPWIAAHEPNATQVTRRFEGPSREHLMGTDRLGRDTFSRVLHGGRMSLLFGVATVAFSGFFGVLLGIFSGFFRAVDEVIMRFIDVLMAFPPILLAMAIVGALGPNLVNAILAIGVAQVPGFVRITRASVLSIRELPFVEASTALGSRQVRVLGVHVFPNIVPTVTVYATLQLSTAILAGAILSFLGLGVQPPTPEWGAMVSEARRYLRLDAMAAIWPIGALFFTVLGFNFLGDGVRDVMDPKLGR